MKKTLLTLTTLALTLTIIFIGCQKNPPIKSTLQEPKMNIVPNDFARIIAEKFTPSIFFNQTNSANQNSRTTAAVQSTLNGNNKIKNELIYNDSYNNAAIYVFNFDNNAGYLFVSADFNIGPILSFVDKGQFTQDSIPAGLTQWINKTVNNTEVVRKGLYDNSNAANLAWGNYLVSNNITVTPNVQKPPPPPPDCTPTTSIVGPLLPVTWGQACTYNDLCPALACNLGCGNQNAYTGCVATSMSQIIRFYQFPAGTYNYASMPAASGNIVVQQLMKDAGTAVSMSYGCSSSGAYGSNVPNAFKNTFRYTSANRQSYSASSGYLRVVSNLNSHWPVLLEGFDVTNHNDGHEWVCDGYEQINYPACNGQPGVGYLYFHMNWGWHEVNIGTDYNGWYHFDNWDIGIPGYNFQYQNYYTTEIHP